MTNALELVASRAVRRMGIRAGGDPVLGFDDWMGMLSLDNVPYMRQTLQPEREDIERSYLGLVEGAYRSNGVVFAAMLARYTLFSEIRFAYQQMRNSRPGNLFGTPDLASLETPQDGFTTADLTATMMLDNDLAGICYQLQEEKGGDIVRLRPDWTQAVFGSARKDAVPSDPDSKLLGYAYHPGGPMSKAEPIVYMPDQVAWFSTTKDALRRVVGQSWLLAIVREITSDTAATLHKLAYFRNAATPNLTVTLPPSLGRDKAKDWIELFEQEHTGALNAFRTIYFGGGATVQAIGANLKDIDYRNVQAAGETRIVAASGIHAVLLGITEGLQGSALQAGNWAAAARWTADRTLRPAWRNAAGSLQRLVGTPNGGARLWYDDRDVPFLRQDVKDAADVVGSEVTAIGSLIKDGFEPDDSVDAVTSLDLRRLVGKHTGLVSVQLQPPGSLLPGPGGTTVNVGQQPAAPAGAAPNGSYVGPVSGLRALLAQGYEPATERDRVIVHAALEGRGRDDILAPILSQLPTVRSRGVWWPVDGPYATLGAIPAGVELPGSHPLARMYAVMFEPATAPKALTAPAAVAKPVRCSNVLASGKRCNRLVGLLAPGSIVSCGRCKAPVAA